MWPVLHVPHVDLANWFRIKQKRRWVGHIKGQHDTGVWVGPRCFASSAIEKGSGWCGGCCAVQSLRRRWSNDEIRATDERKGGSDSRDGESKQVQSWSSDNRAGFVTCLQQTHRKSSFPVGAVHAQHGAGKACWVDGPPSWSAWLLLDDGVCWDVVPCLQVLRFLVAILEVRSKRSLDRGCSFDCNEACKRPKTCSSTQSFTMKYWPTGSVLTGNKVKCFWLDLLLLQYSSHQ